MCDLTMVCRKNPMSFATPPPKHPGLPPFCFPLAVLVKKCRQWTPLCGHFVSSASASAPYWRIWISIGTLMQVSCEVIVVFPVLPHFVSRMSEWTNKQKSRLPPPTTFNHQASPATPIFTRQTSPINGFLLFPSLPKDGWDILATWHFCFAFGGAKMGNNAIIINNNDRLFPDS